MPSGAKQANYKPVYTARLSQFYGRMFDNVRVRMAYRCRAYPGQAQQQALARTFGCVRLMWNRTLAARQARWHLERKGTSYAETDRALTALKKDPDLAFLSEVSSVPLQQALRHQHREGSANRVKAAAKVARAHRKVRDARRDFLHRASTRLVRSADTIVIEDLHVSGMCGAGIRHRETPPVRPAVKQEPQPVTAGIPALQGGE